MKLANHSQSILHCSRTSQAHCLDKAVKSEANETLPIWTIDFIECGSDIANITFIFISGPYHSAAVLAGHTRHYGIGSGSGQAGKQYGPDNPMTIVPGSIVLVTFHSL